MPNALRRDLSYILLLALLAALPLVVLRYIAAAQALHLLAWAIWLIAFVFWVQPLKGVRQTQPKPAPQLLGKSLFISWAALLERFTCQCYTSFGWVAMRSFP